MTFSRLRRSRFFRVWLMIVGLLAILFLMVCDGSPEHFGVSSDTPETERTVVPLSSPTSTTDPASEASTPVTPPAPATSTLTPSPTEPETPAPTQETESPASVETENSPEPSGPEVDDPTPSVDARDSAPTVQWTFEIVATYPHDTIAFTQGLEFVDGRLYESTGLHGRSTVREVELETGKVLRSVSLEPRYFGEGLTVLNGLIYQLTWHSGVAFVYDLDSFELVGELSYPTEGWGLANDGMRLFMSDGSSTLYIRDPHTFAEIGRVEVHDEHGPVTWLNELEYIDGDVFANVWGSDSIARIDPDTGRVRGWIDLSGLLMEEDRAGRRVDVLNGIAWDSEAGRLFVTGKLWPVLYEIALVPDESPT